MVYAATPRSSTLHPPPSPLPLATLSAFPLPLSPSLPINESPRPLQGPRCVINHPDDVLDDMNDWSREQHGRSGLTDNCRASTLSLSEAEELVLEFVTGLVPQAGIAPLAGNSVHVDRNFLRRRMPRLEAHLKFRNVDVSTIAEVAMRWCPRKLKDR